MADAPWQNDLESIIEDPEVRTRVDEYMRSKVQPRMTQYEQQLAASKDAVELWKSFENDPAGTYRAITTQLYGDEAGKAALDALEQRLNPPAADPPPPAPGEPKPDPRFDEVYNYFQERRAKDQEAEELATYDRTVAEIVGRPENADIVPDRYHRFVRDAEGDFDLAIQLYREEETNLRKQALEGLGLTEEQLAELVSKQPPPPTLGHETGGGASAPTSPEYRGREGLNRAIDDVVAQMKAKQAAPPVV